MTGVGTGDLQQVSQLAHVAGEVITLQLLQELALQPRQGLAILGGKLGHEVLAQQRHVVHVLPQGGNQQQALAEPVVEVGPKLPLLHVAAEGLMGGGDEAKIGVVLLLCPEGPVAAGFQHPQQLGLHGGGHVPHLVQEQGAPIGLGHQPRLVGQRPGEGPLLVTEQLALDEVLRDGGAVDGNERLGRPIGALVHQAGHHLLAAAGLPLNEYGQLVLARQAYLLAQPADHRRLADQLIAEQLLMLAQPLSLPLHLAQGVPQHALIPAAAPQIANKGELVAKDLRQLCQLGTLRPPLQHSPLIHHGQHGERLAVAVQQRESVQAALLAQVGEQEAKLLVLDAGTAMEGVPGAGLGLVQHIGERVGKVVHRQGQAHRLSLDPAGAFELATAHIQHAEQYPLGLEAGVQSRAPPVAQVLLVALLRQGEGKGEGLFHGQPSTSATNW
ncbi:hypothetical protein D3C76_654660 [compost metagenome]